MTIRKVLEDTSTVGRTGRATWIILKRIRDEAGFIVNDTAGYHKNLYAEKARVMIDVHGEGKGSYAPGIGSYGPDWQHNMTLQLYHHFVMEMFIYAPFPTEENVLNVYFHDGAYLTERGVEYFSPPPSEIRLIR